MLGSLGVANFSAGALPSQDLQLNAFFQQYLDERFSAASQPTDQEVLQAGEANRQKLTEERRRTLINAWIAELRRRSDISILQ